jgi:hypothetical protein
MVECRTKRIQPVSLALAIALVFLVIPSLAKAEKSNPKSKAAHEKNAGADKAATLGLSTSKVGIDPDGAIRPVTPAEEKKLRAEFLKTLSHYHKQSPIHNADGSVSLVIAPYSLSASVAHRDADGKIKVDCTQDLQTHKIQKASKKNDQRLPEE